MKSFLTGALLLLVPGVSYSAPSVPARPPNVLFIAFDDLNDWIKPLDSTSPIAMPNLARLARRGMMFREAYCAAPECNPSRTALLSGLRPTTSGVYANASDWKQAIPDVIMLPRYFREHGYASRGAGKIFHHVSPHFVDEESFDDYLPFLTDRLPEEKLNHLTHARTPEGGDHQLAPTFDWGESPTDENGMLDKRSADYAAKFIAGPHEKPFFLAVGFFRPHLPYFSPQRFLDRFPPATIPLPVVKPDDLDDVPAGGLLLKKRWEDMFHSIKQAPDPIAKWHEAVAAYAAGATFADEQLGRVLDAIDQSPERDNTIIVVWSDHGYHLGEKDHWTKFVLWEKSTHVPLVIVAPHVTTPGTVCDRPVSLVDLYPTLIELCALPAKADLDGLSLVPLLHDPKAARERPALMTEMRGNHAVRSDRWRYIRYANGDEELYDHQKDPNEWTNLASDPRYRDVIAAHRQWLPIAEAKPAPDFSPTNTAR